MESAPSDLYASLQEAGIDNLLQTLSQKSQIELRLKQNEQRDQPDLSTLEKLELLKSKLQTSPGSFLFQFGSYLTPVHLELFSRIREKDYEVDYYLKEINLCLTKPGEPGCTINSAERNRRKNRRYEALQRLVDKTDYFTEEEMQRRNPILFEQLIGRYHTKEEREAFLQQCSRTSNSDSARTSRGGGGPTPLSDMLMAHMNREEIIDDDDDVQNDESEGTGAGSPFKDHTCSERRREQESQVQDELAADKEINDSEDDDEEAMDEDSRPGNQDQDENNIEEIDDDEKELLKEEFFTTMYRNFLEGKDEDFDYSTVDDNPEYDCGETLEQDEEDKYFDAEEAVDMVEEDEVLKSLKITNGKDGGDDDEEEDELDSYMKSIENELSKQH